MGNNEVLETTPLSLEEFKSVSAQIKGEIDAQVATAKAYPRSVSKAINRITELAARDQATAEKCFYALPRKEHGKIKTIEGPSVRLAEIVGHSWGNLRCIARVIGIDDKFVTCQGGCIDLETNFGVSTEVKRRITTKAGTRYSDDMIMVTSNAGCSIAFRNALFKAVPGALIKDVIDKVKKVAEGDEKTFGSRLMTMVNEFKEMGVTSDKVCALVGVAGVNDLTIAHLRVLIGVKNAIEEGATTVEEAFNPPEKSKKAEDLAGAKNGARVSMKGKTDEAPAKESKGDGQLTVDEMKTLLSTVSKKKLAAAKKQCGFDENVEIEAPDAIAILYDAVKSMKGGES